MRKRFHYGALVVLGLSLPAPAGFFGAALAQATPDECRDISGIDEPNAEVHGCLKPVVNVHALIGVSDALRRVVAGRLAPGGAALAEPAGLALDGPGEIAARLAGNGGIAVEPMADIPAAAEQRLWNVWLDGKYSWIEGSGEVDHSEGPLASVMAGIDYRLTAGVVLGILGTYEDSRLETRGALPVSQKTEGYGGGAYVGITVTPNVIFSGMAAYAAIDTGLGLSRDGEADSDRVQLSGAFTGYWYAGSTRLSPSLTLAWSKEWQDAYSDGLTPKQRFETAVLTGGTAVGHAFALAGAMSMEPWAGAFIDYTFVNDVSTSGPINVRSYDEQVDLRLQLGINLTLAGNVQLAVTGETSGLLLDETDTYAGEANLAIQF
ncbi:MAG: autotransporter outer membrane beta-barrel domain-containing protein [Parvibaculaceae bacterium]